MASVSVHCSVCGDHLHDATENYGGFQVNGTFTGWNQEPGKLPVLEDTCRNCFVVLAKVVTDAANIIVAGNKDANDKLRGELYDQREREAQYKRDEREFQRNWRPKSC